MLKGVGSGDVTFGGLGANTYSGETFVLGGTLRLSRYVLINLTQLGTTAIPGNLTLDGGAVVLLERNNQIANSSVVTLSGGQLNLNGHSETIGGLAGAGTVALGEGGSLSVGANNNSTTFSGSITGAGSFDKIGSGTLTLAGDEAYTGQTRVLDGVLRIQARNYYTSGINVADGAVLGGDGMVSDVTVAAGGTVHPGASGGAASLMVTGAVTFAVSSTLRIGLFSSSNFDSLTVNGGVNLNSCALRLTPSASVRAGDSFTIINNLGSSAVAGQFAGLDEGEMFVVSNRVYRITYRGGSGNDVVVTLIQGPAVSLAISRTHGEQMQIAGRGVPGLPYVLEVGSNLGNSTSWKTIGTNVAASNGTFGWLEDYSPQAAGRFYRAWSP